MSNSCVEQCFTKFGCHLRFFLNIQNQSAAGNVIQLNKKAFILIIKADLPNKPPWTAKSQFICILTFIASTSIYGHWTAHLRTIETCGLQVNDWQIIIYAVLFVTFYSRLATQTDYWNLLSTVNQEYSCIIALN